MIPRILYDSIWFIEYYMTHIYYIIPMILYDSYDIIWFYMIPRILYDSIWFLGYYMILYDSWILYDTIWFLGYYMIPRILYDS